MNNNWTAISSDKELYQASCRLTGDKKWTASRADLVFGSNSELRAIAEVYGSHDGQDKFISDFIAVWNKVMNLDRFDI